MLLQKGEGRVEVGGLGEAPARSSAVGVAAGELPLAGAGDPVQQPAGVIDPEVGAHQVEHRPGVLDQVPGQPDGAGHGVAADRAGPAVAEMAGEVKEAGKAAGGAGELCRPPGQMGQVVAAGGQPGLEVTLAPSRCLPAAWSRVSTAGSASSGRAGRDGQSGGQGLEFQGVAVGHRRQHRWGACLAVADQALGEAVEEPASSPRPLNPPAGQAAQDLRLDGQADGQTRPLDVFGGRPRRSTFSRSPAWPLRYTPRLGPALWL